jgi:hypothetical protein
MEALAIKKWRAGWSFGRIAGLMDKSRGSVSSKIATLGEIGRGGENADPRARRQRLARVRHARNVALVNPEASQYPLELGFKWHAEDGGIPVTAVGANGCRWPMAGKLEVATHFCGAPQRPGSSYCDRHHERSRNV